MGQVGHGAVIVDREPGVHVDDAANAMRHALGDTGDDQAAIAVAHQDDLVQVLELEHVDDVLDVCVEAHVPTEEMAALAQSCQGRGHDVVASSAQVRRHPLPAPAAQPCAVDENEGGHDRLRFGFGGYVRSVESASGTARKLAGLRSTRVTCPCPVVSSNSAKPPGENVRRSPSLVSISNSPSSTITI